MTNDEMIKALADVRDQLVRNRVRPEVAPPFPGATREADKLAGMVKALVTMQEVAKGWAEGAAEEQVAREQHDPQPAGLQAFRLGDILVMINDAARELGISGFDMGGPR